MPEGRASFIQDRSTLQPMDLPMDEFEADPCEAAGLLESSLNRSRDLAKSIESLNTLLMSMPEISIPNLVHNPLPLQCLAASALPVELRREIDGLIAEYALFCEDYQQQGSCKEPASTAATPVSDATVTDVTRATEDVEEVDFATAEQVSACI